MHITITTPRNSLLKNDFFEKSTYLNMLEIGNNQLYIHHNFHEDFHNTETYIHIYKKFFPMPFDHIQDLHWPKDSVDQKLI